MARPVKKYIDKETKKVAVLVSLGYGAGWSSWVYRSKGKEIATFDYKIVRAILKSNRAEVVRTAEAKIPGFYSERRRAAASGMGGSGSEFPGC